ncbi:MAG: transcriptional repressor LexA [Candidatus Acididesulfobacter diazotrophicus]|jgi:repressor LexA|uniref:LexA repressor n=1 Tax=Candidatus Acididesulfobacter diazotrophicus TaxID=2597226 RepID=A0A519BNA3_9DELT|nr:MAG: transcriptional repressor LexA [Candidatus Acididesulfobacter diazotrophicus]
MLSKKQKDVLDFITNYIDGRGYSPSYSEIGDALSLSSKSTVFKHIQSLTERGFIKNIPGKKRTLQVIGNRENLIRLIKDTKNSRTGNGIINSNNININNTVIAADDIDSAGDIGNNNIAIIKYSSNANTDILNMQRNFIHLYGYIAAGYPIEAIQTDEMIELPEILAKNSGKKLFALKVRGDSMIEDMILDGDIIILKECSEVPNGKIVAAIVNDYEATLKRYYALENSMVKLMPSNPAYKPILISKSKVKIIGELKGLIRKYGF